LYGSLISLSNIIATVKSDCLTALTDAYSLIAAYQSHPPPRSAGITADIDCRESSSCHRRLYINTPDHFMSFFVAAAVKNFSSVKNKPNVLRLFGLIYIKWQEIEVGKFSF